MSVLKTALMAASLSVCAGAASAAVSLTYSGQTYGVNMTMTAPVPVYGYISSPYTVGTRAGEFTMGDSSNALGLGTSFAAFCLDLVARQP